MKQFITSLLFVAVLAMTGSAQWVNKGVFMPKYKGADSTYKSINGSGLHGIAVDPDGNVWFAAYGSSTSGVDSVLNGLGGYTKTRQLFVVKPDGTQMPFSPIKTVTLPGGVIDTLYASNTTRGIGSDKDGNILFATYDMIYRIDYKTGAGLGKFIPKTATAGVQPEGLESGEIITGHVVGGNPIQLWNADLTFKEMLVDTSVGFSRALAGYSNTDATKDLTLFWAGYTNHAIFQYYRADDLSKVALVDTILKGFDSESVQMDPLTKTLWASSGSKNDAPNRYPGVTTSYTIGTWYEYDPGTKAIVDSIKWDFALGGVLDSANTRPRGIAFNKAGNIAYFGVFGSAAYPQVQYAEYSGAATATVTFNANMTVQMKKGNFKTTDELFVKGDLDGWGAGYKMADADGDSIYTVAVSGLTVGTEYNHKFFFTPSGWEADPNRKFVAANGLVVTRFFNDESVFVSKPEVTMTVEFTADLRTILGSGTGYFDPATDSVLVNGLDWDNLGKNVTGNRKLVEDAFNPGTFKGTLAVTGFAGDSTKWKYKGFPDAKFANGGWELGADRWIKYPATNQTVTLPVIVPNIFPLQAALTSDVPLTFIMNVPAGSKNAIDKSEIPVSQITFLGLKGSLAIIGAWAGAWVPVDTAAGQMVALYKTSSNQWKRTITATSGTAGGTFEFKFGADYPGASTVPGVGAGYLDNEGGFGANHFANLVQKPEITWILTWGDFTAIKVEKQGDAVPAEFALEQNYPNPFNPSTKISFALPTEGNVSLKVYNSLGEEVANLMNNVMKAGAYSVNFDASNLTSGVYFYSLQYNGTVSTKKMVLMK